MTSNELRKRRKEIIIDCAPGFPRPNHILEIVLNGTGIPVLEKSYSWFGEWGWDYSSIPDKLWDEQISLIEERFNRAYESGWIRYSKWTKKV